jgi:hypothetical protein
MRGPAAALSRHAAWALALVAALAGCRDRAPAAPAGQAPASGTPAAGPRPIARAEVADAAPEPDGAPIAAADVLEGGAAETAMAASLAADAGLDAGVAEIEWVVGSDGLGPLRLGATSAEVAALLPGVRLVPARVPAGQPARESATLLEAGRVWLQLGLYAGRLTEITVTARTPRALTSEGLGVDSTFEEAVIAHGTPRAVTAASGALRGWVLEDLPGVLWEATPGVKPVADEDGHEGPPPAARVVRLRILGATTLAADD